MAVAWTPQEQRAHYQLVGILARRVDLRSSEAGADQGCGKPEGVTFVVASLVADRDAVVDIAADVVVVHAGNLAYYAAFAALDGTCADAYVAVHCFGAVVRVGHFHSLLQTHPALGERSSAAVVGAAAGVVESNRAVDAVPYQRHDLEDAVDAVAEVFVVFARERENQSARMVSADRSSSTLCSQQVCHVAWRGDRSSIHQMLALFAVEQELVL